MAKLRPKRGEIWWVNFDPSIGSEVKKLRPAVIVSNDISNRYLDRVQAVPLTSNVKHIYPSECLVTVKRQPGKAMADQLRTISLQRCQNRIGKLSPSELSGVDNVLALQLGLSQP